MSHKNEKETVVAFLPNSITTSFTIMLDEVQSNLKQGKHVILIGCEGFSKYCDLNLMGSKYTCIACSHCLKNAIKFLKGDFEYFNYNTFLSKNNYTIAFDKKINDFNEFKKLKYKHFDIGYAVASTYISAIRNRNPAFTKAFKKIITSLYRHSAYIYDAAEVMINELRPEKILVYNGRLHISRPIFSLAKKYNIHVDIIEAMGGFGGKPFEKIKFKNSLPFDIKTNTVTINKDWESISDEENKNAKSYFEKRKKGIETDDKVYVKKQTIGLLPKNFDCSKNNFAIFVSSDDEMAAIGEEWEWTYFGGSQLNAIEKILELFQDNKNYHFYLRIHPNLKDVRYKYHMDYHKLSDRYDNLTAIPAESSISTYALLDSCNKIISFGSTVGIEATYWRKPSILIGNALYMYLDATYNPQTEDELRKLLTDEKLEPKPVVGALKYGYYQYGKKGKNLEYFNFNNHRKSPVWLNHNLYLYNLDPEHRINFSATLNFILFSSARFLIKFIFKKMVPAQEA
jgi:hypothetical protein